MKLGQATREGRGSFGIPPEMHPDNVLNQTAGRQQSSDEEEHSRASPPQSTDGDFEVDEDEEDSDGASTEDVLEAGGETRKTSKQILAEIGVTLTAQDWSDFVFRGYMEKRILIIELPTADGKLKPFYATFKTVTAEEGDIADGLLSQEVNKEAMTIDGVGTRREMWNLSFAIQKLDDKPLCKPVQITDPQTKVARLDLAATAKEKRQILSKMSPVILQMMMDKYWTFLRQTRLMLAEPKSNFLERP